MRRVLIVSSVIAAMLFLGAPDVRAAGGGAPPPFTAMIVKPTLDATILVDTHTPLLTGTAGQATIFVRQGTLTTQFTFNVLPDAQIFWAHGCDTSFTNARFLWSPPTFENTLADWVPPFVLESLFLPFGVIASPTTLVPAITQISNGAGNGQCLPLGDTGVVGPGWLLMNATIQFLAPVK
jgi:hypothetical protein